MRPPKEIKTCNTLTITGPDPSRPGYSLTRCRVCESTRSSRRDKLTSGQAHCQACDGRRTTHGRTRRQRHYLYALHANIKQRIKRPKYASLPIPFHPLWQQHPEVFRHDVLASIGQRPTPRHTLDRIDSRKGYVPGNIRWLTPLGQNRNRANVKRYALTPDSPAYTLQEWAEYLSKLTGEPWTARKLKALLKHFTIEQINSAVHPERRTPAELKAAEFRREQIEAEEALRRIVPDGLAPFDPSPYDEADGDGEVFENWD